MCESCRRTTGGTRARSSSRAAMCCSSGRLRPRGQAPLQEDTPGRLQRRPALQVAAVRQPARQPRVRGQPRSRSSRRSRGSGLVYPPTIHIGYPTMGRGWWSNKPGFEMLAERARHPRPARRHLSARALRLHVRRPAARRSDSLSSTSGATSSSAAPKPTATAASRTSSSACRPTRRASSATTRAPSRPFEYMSHQPHGVRVQLRRALGDDPRHTYEQIEFLKLAGYVGHGRLRDFARIYMRLHHPGTGARIRRALEPDRTARPVVATRSAPSAPLRARLLRERAER